MNSVSLQTKLSHNTKLRLKACLDYSNFLDERTCYELMEFYVDAQTKIFHWCNKHKKSYLAKPNNIKSGKQLKCCGNEAKSDYKIKMALARHKEKIRTRGYILTGDYQGMNVAVEYFCIRHQETDKRKPVIMNRGSAVLECSKNVTKIAQAKKRSLEKLLNYLMGKIIFIMSVNLTECLKKQSLDVEFMTMRLCIACKYFKRKRTKMLRSL